MANYLGQEIQVLRNAKDGDPGYDQSKDQVVVRTPDGKEQVVERREVSGA